MAHAYSPGLTVAHGVVITKTRELPLKGKVTVKVGDTVRSDAQVLSADRPGDLVIMKVAEQAGLESADVLSGMKVKVGDKVQAGTVVCEVKTFFGFFTSQVVSRVAGVVEFFTEANAHLGIRLPSTPLTISAYIEGQVTEVQEGRSVTIEAVGTLVQGIFGIGGECHGILRLLPVGGDALVGVNQLKSEQMRGRVLVGGASFDQDAIDYARSGGATAIITGSVKADTLRHLNAMGGGLESRIKTGEPFTFIVTEGFGEIPMAERVQAVLRSLDGKMCSLNGTTQVRAGAMRPEIIITDNSVGQSQLKGKGNSTELEIGSSVRLIRVPHFGKLASVVELPLEPQVIETGAKVRVLKAKLSGGEIVTVPRANVELL